MHRKHNRLLPVVFGILLLYFGGCVTTEEVRDIVSNSNQTMLGQILGSGVSLDGESSKDWESVSNEILTFIAEHPEQTVSNNALRVRLAMLYLQNEKLALAEAAFSEIEVGRSLDIALPLSRDRALYEAREALLFINTYSNVEDGFSREIKNDAMNALNSCHEQIENLVGSKNTQVRNFFREAQALLAIQYFLSIPYLKSENPNSYDLLSRAFEDLAGDLKKEETRLTRSLADDSNLTLDQALQKTSWIGLSPSLPTLRRILRAKTVLSILIEFEKPKEGTSKGVLQSLGHDSIVERFFPNQ